MDLVITEKFQVAQVIARVLGANQKEEGYLIGGGYLVSWCVGHLVSLAPPEAYSDTWKKWNYESLPILPEQWKYEVRKETETQYHVLKRLLQEEKVERVIAATDAGREGELIFRLVYQQAGCKKPIKRLWISSMEERAIREGFANLKEGSAYEFLYQSALCRQRADWLVGLNGTRLFTALYGGKVLKVGRVQTPTLAMLVEREEKIRNFQKESYYLVQIQMGGMIAISKRIDKKEKAEEIAEICQNGQAVVVSMEKEEKAIVPPKLYDLTTLQRDANRIFGFTAKQTLEYTQSLYEKKLVTYPRTDSQYLSDDMEQTTKDVIKVINQLDFWKEIRPFHLEIKKVLNRKKVTDHHAIIPTVEMASADLAVVPKVEYKILFLLANRLLCATGANHFYETISVKFSCNGYEFSVSEKRVIQNGWKSFEDTFKQSFSIREDTKEKGSMEEKKLPELSKGQIFDSVQTTIREGFTSPPKHFTEDSLLSMMERAGSGDMGDDVERKGLGTPATRADIIEKLVKDGLVRREKKQMVPTEDGIKLITVLPDVVKSPKLTADWENALTLVAKGEYSMQEFMDGIEDMVKELVQTYHSVSDEQKIMFGSDEREIFGKCPKCGGDVVKGKFGAYCKNKCGMNVSRVMGTVLTDSQIKSMLEGKKTLVKGLKGKKGSYDAYLIPEGVEDYSYTKDGKEVKGLQYKVKLEFPKKKK